MLTVKNAMEPVQLHFRLVMSHAKDAVDRAITTGTETTSENAAVVMVLARFISMNMTLRLSSTTNDMSVESTR